MERQKLMAATARAAAQLRFYRLIFGAENIKRHLQGKKSIYARDAETSIAQINRHTGRAHEDKREASRRMRQMARAA